MGLLRYSIRCMLSVDGVGCWAERGAPKRVIRQMTSMTTDAGPQEDDTDIDYCWPKWQSLMPLIPWCESLGGRDFPAKPEKHGLFPSGGRTIIRHPDTAEVLPTNSIA